MIWIKKTQWVKEYGWFTAQYSVRKFDPNDNKEPMWRVGINDIDAHSWVSAHSIGGWQDLPKDLED